MPRRRALLLSLALPLAACSRAPEPRESPTQVDAGLARTSTRAPSPEPKIARPSLRELAEGGPLDPIAERLCGAVVTSVYARRAACCSGPVLAEQGLPCMRALSDSLAKGAVSVDHGELVRCAAAMAKVVEGCEWVAPRMPEPPEVCRAIVKGHLAEAATCSSDLECDEGLHCKRDPARPSQPGTCRGPSPVGEPCGLGVVDLLAASTRQLDAGLHHPECAGVCRNGRCAPAVPPGGACASGAECPLGHHCSEGKCTKGQFAKLGAPCTESLCEDGAVCAGDRCVPLGTKGTACASAAECKGTCILAKGATSGTCGMTCEGGLPDALARPIRTTPPEKAIGRFRLPAR